MFDTPVLKQACGGNVIINLTRSHRLIEMTRVHCNGLLIAVTNIDEPGNFCKQQHSRIPHSFWLIPETNFTTSVC